MWRLKHLPAQFCNLCCIFMTPATNCPPHTFTGFSSGHPVIFPDKVKQNSAELHHKIDKKFYLFQMSNLAMPKKIYIFWLFTSLIALFGPLRGLAQLDNRAFEDTLRPQPLHSVVLHWHHMGFLYNTEYFNDIVLGRTLMGIHSTPRLSYAVSDRLAIELGGWLWQDFGNEQASAFRPVFGFRYQNPNGFGLRFGMLDGHLRHRLPEPMFDFARVIGQRLEQGLQLTWQRNGWQSEIWIDWRRMIYQDSPFQEEFVAGQTIMRHWRRWSLMAHAVQSHRGGQINQVRGAVTEQTQSLGLRYTDSLRTRWAHQWWLEARLLRQTRDTGRFLNGQGFYANAQLSTRHGALMLSYWYGDQWTNAVGGPLYSGESQIPGSTFATADRQLVFLRLLRDIRLAPGHTLSLRAEPYMDLQTGLLEYSFGFYLHSSIRALLGYVRPPDTF